MFDSLQIQDGRERLLVGVADLMLRPVAWGRQEAAPTSPRRVLLLRLERIGDLLMTRSAIAHARAAWPDAAIDLAVGSWNAPLARLIPGLSQIVVVDVPWLAREGTGESWRTLVTRAHSWRDQRYDVTINFEPDIRSNVLAWLSAAPRRVGYWTGGGGAVLTESLAYDPSLHVAVNAERLVARASRVPAPDSGPAPLVPGPEAEAAAALRLRDVTPGHRRVGLHVSGGRQSKQWHLERFAAVGRALAAEGGVTIVLTGSPGDRALVDSVLAQMPNVPTVDTSGQLDLPATAALLGHLDVMVTGDTGPMHLAAAVGTPVVALFGPSDPRRYGPLGTDHTVLRVQLPCSPCGLVRLPPERCRGHVPDCMDGIHVHAVVEAARRVLERGAR